MPSDRNADFEKLLEYIQSARGFNVGAYKRPSLMRRIDYRRRVVGISAYADYVDCLQVHREEFPELFNTILINVTNFFRDPEAWQFVEAEIVPRILARHPEDAPIRVWSAGCASGEEAYAVAMIFANMLGTELFRQRVKVYATDADPHALNQARAGSYSSQQVEGVPAPYLEKYFKALKGRYTFHRDLRPAVIFGRHDLTQDAPISQVDLLICRNTLMYFNAEAQ